MCRMLAKISHDPSGIMNEMEQCPNSLLWLSENGIKSHDPNVRGRHNDGCGMAYVDNSGKIKSIKKSKAEFWDTEYHDFAANASSKLYIAHNRFASEGLETNTNGAHPFLILKNGEQIAFCHNGGVDSYMSEARKRNTSDSEILLENIVDRISDLSVKEIAKAITSIAITTEYSSLCAFMLNNNQLFAWRIFNEKRKADFDKLSRYYTLYISIRPGFILIASEPLDDNSRQLIPNNMLINLKPDAEGVTVNYSMLNIH